MGKMKILLVEDLDEKAKQVEAALKDVLSGPVLHRACSFITATRFLEQETYDLLVLDIVLPMRDGAAPASDGGRQVLMEVMEGAQCHPPSHIIALTAHEDVAEILRDELQKSLIHLVVYNETDLTWRGQLQTKARYVQERLRDALLRPENYSTDVAIVTSSPHVELKAVSRLPGGFVAEYDREDALHYYSSKWTTSDHRDLSIVACAAPTMGMTAACVTACKVIERWRPRFLVMCGIAAATQSEQRPGDILVAEACYDYGSGKILEIEDSKRVFLPSPNQLRIDPALHAVVQEWEREQRAMDEIRRQWHSEPNHPPKLVLGILATGAAVIQSEALVQEILNTSRKVVGLDMEGYGIFQAAHLSRKPRPRVLIAKAVSDFADKGKSDTWQAYAAFTSAQFIYHLFTRAEDLEFDERNIARADGV
jgi:nucleoside phosphorylase